MTRPARPPILDLDLAGAATRRDAGGGRIARMVRRRSRRRAASAGPAPNRSATASTGLRRMVSREGAVMAKPVLIVVDDDLQVLQAIARDLRRHYGMRYRVMQVISGTAALTLLQKLRQRDEPV